MASKKITKEEKLAQIAEARELLVEAQALIDKAHVLIKKDMKGVEICGGDSYKEQAYPEVYKGMIEVHVYKGILKLEKLLDIKAEPKIDFCGNPSKSRKALCVGGIEFFQLGEATQSRYNFK